MRMDPADSLLCDKKTLLRAGCSSGGTIQTLSAEGTYFSAGPVDYLQFDDSGLDFRWLLECADKGMNLWRTERVDLMFGSTDSVESGSITLARQSELPGSVEDLIGKTSRFPVALCRLPFTWKDIDLESGWQVGHLTRVRLDDEGRWSRSLEPRDENYDVLSQELSLWFQGEEISKREIPRCPLNYLELCFRLLEVHDAALSSGIQISAADVFEVLINQTEKLRKLIAGYVDLRGETLAISMLGRSDFEDILQGQIPYRAEAIEDATRNQTSFSF